MRNVGEPLDLDKAKLKEEQTKFINVIFVFGKRRIGWLCEPDKKIIREVAMMEEYFRFQLDYLVIG